jgi:hypothetical protein
MFDSQRISHHFQQILVNYDIYKFLGAFTTTNCKTAPTCFTTCLSVLSVSKNLKTEKQIFTEFNIGEFY